MWRSRDNYVCDQSMTGAQLLIGLGTIIKSNLL